MTSTTENITRFQLTRSRGARLSMLRLQVFPLLNFNSRAHVERDAPSASRTRLPFRHFNSRAHVERDRNTLKILRCSENFNSRAHVERDNAGLNGYKKPKKISTHALTWSATRLPVFSSRNDQYFNSRAHVERDRRTDEPCGAQQKFQLTRSRGARH